MALLSSSLHAQSGTQLGGPSAGTPLGNRSCASPLPLPPENPSTSTEYGCYYFGTWNWNSGNGAGLVRGRIYWPSICGDGTSNPPGIEKLPTVLLMHGDGHDYKDYGYLMRHLAQNGFIAATIENQGSNADRSLSAQAYLEFMTNNWVHRDWVDHKNLGLIGHSRGGEAVLTLARNISELGLDYDVNAIISLAPTDNQEGGGPEESLTASSSESFLAIYGTHDEDVTGYCNQGGLPECGNPVISARRTGFALYDRAGSEGSTEPFPLYDDVVDKSLLYIEGANHNAWRSTCSGLPLQGNLTCTEHWEMAKGYMNSFLRWRLLDQDIYRHYFNGDLVLPVVATGDIKVQTSYSKGYDRRVIDNFEQAGWGTNTVGGSVWKESSLSVQSDGPSWAYDSSSPHDTNSLVVSWLPGGLAPWIRFEIPNSATLFGGRKRDITRYEFLSIRAGQTYLSNLNTPGMNKDFWVQLRDSSGAQSSWVRAGEFTRLPYPTEATVQKFGQTLDVVTSSMKSVRLPVCRFEGIDKQNVSSIWFYFTVQGSSRGELMLDNIEFTD